MINSAFALFFGAIGAVLRKIELNTVFEPGTGLALLWEPITIALAVLSAFAVLLSVLLSSGYKKVSDNLNTYCRAFSNKSSLPFLLSSAAAVGIAVGSVLYYLDNKTALALILLISGAAAAISVFILARCAYFNLDGPVAAVCSTVIVIFISLWMVLEYKMRSADPVLLDYAYDFLALCSALLALYYKAGFAFSKPKPRPTMVFSQISAYFSCVAIPGASGTAQAIFFSCLALLLVVDMPALAANIKKEE